MSHGGAAKQVREKAARTRAERKYQALLEGIGDYEPVADPLAELQRLAGRALRWLNVFEGIVADLHRIRYTTQAEQIDGRVVIFERAMDRLGKLLVDIARLDIDERMARIDEARGKLVVALVLGVFADLGLSAELQLQARAAIGHRLLLVESQEGQRERPPLALEPVLPTAAAAVVPGEV